MAGAFLHAAGLAVIDGIDLSEDMLCVAGKKGCYRGLVTGDVTKSLQLSDAPYAGIVGAVTITFGQFSP
ncbi:hypothetical protein SLH49_00140 [Cognatiyoonia sp. IB215446]|uniref:hypothetical protein n=1 Tax=Cognatiyoonia sp. IB215446 TaxID=3097355 RepID=UPI002A12A19B|nr:hypothetical protein [Cognatiyoonia sp. IB215446]MDX8346384.1 hypothetical protein [Cognatiyoonia sp. IB215446]